jgi:excisionase family DNA binding protein
MQVESTRLYRVRAVAEALDVSVATIYRAVESGALRAVRMGTGKGAVRIPGQAIGEYLAACESAAATAARRAPGAQECGVCTPARKRGTASPAGLLQAESASRRNGNPTVEAVDAVAGGAS